MRVWSVHDAESSSTGRAAASIVMGGLLMAALFVPFTLAHGPTSINEEREILGMDMHVWGLLLGVGPNVLIGFGVWRLRFHVPGASRVTPRALTVLVAALSVSAALDLAFLALGPPLLLPMLAIALVVAAVSLVRQEDADLRTTAVLALLGLVLSAGFVLALVPMATSDGFGGYRIFGFLVHLIAGLLWAALGLALARAAVVNPVTEADVP